MRSKIKIFCTVIIILLILILHVIAFNITEVDNPDIICKSKNLNQKIQIHYKNLNYQYYKVFNNFPVVKILKEYFKSRTNPKIQNNIFYKTYHTHFNSEIKNPLVLQWYSKNSRNSFKPSIIIITFQGLLHPDVSSIADELYDTISNNKYLIVGYEKLFLYKNIQDTNIKLSTIKELNIIDDADFVYNLIELIQNMYPNTETVLYGYSLGAVTIYDYIKNYGNMQNISNVILNSPLFNIKDYLKQNGFFNKIFNKWSCNVFKDCLKKYNYVFKTPEEITLYSAVTNSNSISEIMYYWITLNNLKIYSIYDMKYTNIPITAIVSLNDPIIKYTKHNLINYCKSYHNLTCIVFNTGEHVSFRDKDGNRVIPKIIHNILKIKN